MKSHRSCPACFYQSGDRGQGIGGRLAVGWCLKSHGSFPRLVRANSNCEPFDVNVGRTFQSCGAGQFKVQLEFDTTRRAHSFLISSARGGGGSSLSRALKLNSCWTCALQLMMSSLRTCLGAKNCLAAGQWRASTGPARQQA